MRALILTDIQNCFLPGGALPVTDGDAVVPVANRLTPHFELVVATKDWHPADHGSFASTHGRHVGETIDLHGVPQILWPDHCVQGTEGSEFAPGFRTERIAKIILKATDPGIDSYSAFYDNARRRDTGLADYLAENDVDEIYVMGLATDYCVKFTVLDARRLGFRTYLVVDGCRGVDLQPDDSEKAIREMEEAGAVAVDSDRVIEEMGRERQASVG